MANVRVAPSLLAADFSRLGEQVRECEAGGADLLHIDVMDGRFVPNITMGPLVVEAIKRTTQLPLDVHLMIVEPDHMLSAFAEAGADTISVHWEACRHLHRTLQTIKSLGCRAGVALNPHTPANFLADILPMIDVIIVMTVNPGFGGQVFLADVVPKINLLKAMIAERKPNIEIEVDGGINVATARQAAEAGADVLIAGSAIFNAEHSIQAGISALRRAVEK